MTASWSTSMVVTNFTILAWKTRVSDKHFVLRGAAKNPRGLSSINRRELQQQPLFVKPRDPSKITLNPPYHTTNVEITKITYYFWDDHQKVTFWRGSKMREKAACWRKCASWFTHWTSESHNGVCGRCWRHEGPGITVPRRWRAGRGPAA